MSGPNEISEIYHNICIGVKAGQLIFSSINEDNRRVSNTDFKNTFFPDGTFYEVDKMVLIHNPWTQNFQHFLDETIPLCIESKDEPEVYVTVWPSFGDDIINFLKINNIKKIEENTCFRIKKLIRKKIRYVDFRLNEECNVNKPLGFVRKKVTQYLQNNNRKILFIKRDVKKRSCENINQLIDNLEIKFNIDVIENFSSLTIKEKIIILSYYDTIISMYGATSANVLFKNSGKWIILSNPWSVNDTFIKNLNPDLEIHNIDNISKYLDSNSIHTRSGEVTEDKEFVIDIDRCLSQINQILNQPPTPPVSKAKEKLST